MKSVEKEHRKALKNKAKLLMVKNEDRIRAERLAKNTPQMGQKRSEILLILGEPSGIDTKVTKRCKIEVLKYQPYGYNRYKLKITLKDGVVIEWDKRE